MVSIPIALRRVSAFGPMPLMRPTGSGQIRVAMSPGPISVSPSGLSRSEAIFASSLFGAMPTEQVSAVSSRIARLIARPISALPAAWPVRST